MRPGRAHGVRGRGAWRTSSGRAGSKSLIVNALSDTLEPSTGAWARHPSWGRGGSEVCDPGTVRWIGLEILGNARGAANARLRPSLEGQWLAEVELLESKELPSPVTAGRISGELKLEPMGPAPTSVYTGTSTLDFSPLGLRLGSDEMLVSVEESGVRMILDPSVDHGHVAATVAGGAPRL